MAKVDLTPAKLAELRQKAEAAEPIGPSPWRFSKTIEEYRTLCEVRDNGDYQVVHDMSVEEGEHITAADPATVLAMVEEIERLRELQCWIVVELNGELAAGPFFTKCDAENFRLADLCDDDDYPTYKVQVWNKKESEAGQ